METKGGTASKEDADLYWLSVAAVGEVCNPLCCIAKPYRLKVSYTYFI